MNRLLTLGSFPAVVMAVAIAAAVALVVDYRALSDGSIDHSSSLVLLNESGRVLARSGEADDPTKFIAALRQAVEE